MPPPEDRHRNRPSLSLKLVEVPRYYVSRRGERKTVAGARLRRPKPNNSETRKPGASLAGIKSMISPILR